MRSCSLLLSFTVVAMHVSAIGDEIPDFPADQVEYFETEVAGILQANCLKCHSGATPKGGLDLTQRAGIVTGGESGSAVDLLTKALTIDGYSGKINTGRGGLIIRRVIV